MTLTEAQVEAAVQRTAGALDGRAPLDRIVRAGRGIWQDLLAAQPRLANLVARIADAGLAQPVAWSGRSDLLARLAPAPLIAHTGEDFVSVAAGAHYLLPVKPPGEDRTLQRRRASPQPAVKLVDLREAEPERRRALIGDASTEEIGIIVDPVDAATTLSTLLTTVHGSQVSPTRAALLFGRCRPDAALIDELLAHLPCVSFADDGLADAELLEELELALRDRGATLPIPSIRAHKARAGVLKATERRISTPHGNQPSPADVPARPHDADAVPDAHQELQAAADAGDAAAAFTLWERLRDADLAAAEGWLRTAAELGGVRAAHRLGMLLWERREIDAAETALRGATADPRGAHALGRLLWRERNDPQAAVQWLDRAAQADDPAAERDLGIVLREDGDLQGAHHWLSRAAERDGEARQVLAELGADQ